MTGTKASIQEFNSPPLREWTKVCLQVRATKNDDVTEMIKRGKDCDIGNLAENAEE